MNRADVLFGLILSPSELHFDVILPKACCEFRNLEGPVATSCRSSTYANNLVFDLKGRLTSCYTRILNKVGLKIPP